MRAIGWKYFWVFCFGIFNCHTNRRWKDNQLWVLQESLTFSFTSGGLCGCFGQISPIYGHPTWVFLLKLLSFSGTLGLLPLGQAKVPTPRVRVWGDSFLSVVCFFGHISPICGCSTWVFHSFTGTAGLLPRARLGFPHPGFVMGPLGANSRCCNSYRSTMQPLGPQPQ